MQIGVLNRPNLKFIGPTYRVASQMENVVWASAGKSLLTVVSLPCTMQIKRIKYIHLDSYVIKKFLSLDEVNLLQHKEN